MNKEELIENYFSDQISEEAFLQLKTFLEEDAAFKKEFYLQLEIQQTIAQEKHVSLKKRLKELDKKLVDSPANKTEKNRWYLYAAAATILFAIGFLFYETQPNYEKLYAAHFEPYPNVIVPTVRNAETSEENNVSAAFNYYDNRQYADAATAFYKLYQVDSKDYAFFYHSVSLMAVGNTQKAITTLESHRWNEPEDYQTITHWYLGLGYLKLQDEEKAITHLEKVANSSKPLAKQAKEIMQKLK